MVLAAYGLGRAVAGVWGPVRDDRPVSVVGWSVLLLNVASAVQGFTAAAVVASLGRRRGRRLWWVAVGAGAVVWLCVLVWIGDGRGDAGPQARDLLLGVAFAVVIPIVAGWRPSWALGPEGLDWPRVRRVLRDAAGGALVVGVAGLTVYFTLGPGGAGHRAAAVLSWLGFVAAFVLFGCMMMAMGEQRRLRREAIMDDLYAQLNKVRSQDDDLG
jgi:hypothetical protein